MINKTPNAQGGIKFDNEKLMFDLLEPEFEEGIVKVLTIGAKKYAPENWKKIEPRRYYAALMRHWNAYRKGENDDPETGLSHLYHAACCLMFLDWFDRQEKSSHKWGDRKVETVYEWASQTFTKLQNEKLKKEKTKSIVEEFEKTKPVETIDDLMRKTEGSVPARFKSQTIISKKQE